MKHLKKFQFLIIVSALTLIVILFPTNSFADVVPLAPLPTNFDTDTKTIGGYINTLFFLAISTGAVLAVLRIIWGGFRYMISEAVGDVKEARRVITQALVGLILLLSSWLILYQINPDLINLNTLSFEKLGSLTPQSEVNEELSGIFNESPSDSGSQQVSSSDSSTRKESDVLVTKKGQYVEGGSWLDRLNPETEWYYGLNTNSCPAQLITDRGKTKDLIRGENVNKCESKFKPGEVKSCCVYVENK